MDANERISRLVEWATSHGASLHPSVEVYQDATTGFSFRVKQRTGSSDPSLAPWECIVSLPTTLTLSYLNTIPSISPSTSNAASNHHNGHPFTDAFTSKTPPHVIGRFFLIWHYLLGEKSFWWPYIQALPQPEEEEAWQLAPFWPADDAELLEGTNVEVGLEKIKRDVGNEYSRAAELLAYLQNQDSGGTVDGDAARLVSSISGRLYQWAYCIFSSRSFRPSLVLSEEEQARLPGDVRIDDFSVLLPLFDIGNHDMTAEVRWEVDRAATAAPTNETSQGGGGRPSRCQLRVGRPFHPGQQVFNNYSMKTNAELLLGYGFLLPATEALHNDYTHVRKRAATTDAAEEYYISRRPMDHPSSLLGRHRQQLTVAVAAPGGGGGRQVLGAFRHVQTDMVWDIFTTLLQGYGEDLDSVLAPASAGLDGGPGSVLEDQQQRFFCGEVGEGCQRYVEQTMAVIQNKVFQELERLDETEVEVEEDDWERLTANQRLALEYRRRCRLVLENTLEAMTAE